MTPTIDIIKAAKAAAPQLAWAGSAQKNRALLSMADALEYAANGILAANAQDVEASREKYGPVMIDRLSLSPARIKGMADGIREVAALEDPVGRVLSRGASASDPLTGFLRD